MNKSIFFAVALAAITMVSCNNGGNKTTEYINDAEADSMAYNLGLAQSGGLKNYMIHQLGVDSAYIEDFIKGMQDGVNLQDSAKMAYNKGLEIGSQVIGMAQGLSQDVYDQDSTMQINPAKILAGLIEGLKMADGQEKDSLLMQANNLFNEKNQTIKENYLNKKYEEWKKQNADYLAENAKKAGVVTLENGVQYKVIEEGNGKPGSAINKDSVVTCDYVGKMIDGTQFDSSKEEGKKPIQVNMKRPGVIPGWVEVLKIMPKDAVWEVTIPDSLGYGPRKTGDIKPYSTLVFTIETKERAVEEEEPQGQPAPIQIK